MGENKGNKVNITPILHGIFQCWCPALVLSEKLPPVDLTQGHWAERICFDCLILLQAKTSITIILMIETRKSWKHRGFKFCKAEMKSNFCVFAKAEPTSQMN